MNEIIVLMLLIVGLLALLIGVTDERNEKLALLLAGVIALSVWLGWFLHHVVLAG